MNKTEIWVGHCFSGEHESVDWLRGKGWDVDLRPDIAIFGIKFIVTNWDIRFPNGRGAW